MKQSRQNILKRILSAVIVVTVVLSLSACGRIKQTIEVINDIYNLEGTEMAYGNAFEWCTLDSTDGFAKTQGENNFYYMYTSYTDIKFQLKSKMFSECIYSEKRGGWIAAFDNREIVTFKNSNGRDKNAEGIDMSFGTKGANITPVIGFKAPQNGVYTFKILNLDIGTSNSNGINSNGVRLLMYVNDSKLVDEESNNRVKNYNGSIKVTLKQNQFIYLAVDPKGSEHYDVANSIVLQAELEGDYRQFYVDNNVAWGFGKVYDLGTKTRQGVDGWSYHYTSKDEYGIYESKDFKECVVQYKENSCYFVGDNKTKITPSEGVIVAGENTASVVALNLPRDGYYAFDIYFDKAALGNFSVYCGERRVRIPSFEEGVDGHMYFEAVMKENENFYFILSEGECAVNIAVRQVKNPLETESIK